jgi:hypothetical protein
MFPCSLTTQAGCQRRSSTALTTRESRRPSSAWTLCDPRSFRPFANPWKFSKLSNSKKLKYLVLPFSSGNSCRRLGKCSREWIYSQHTGPTAKDVSLSGLHTAPTPAAHGPSRSYGLDAKRQPIPMKPGSKPSNALAPRRLKDEMIAQPENMVITKPRPDMIIRLQPPIERPEQQEPGLRDDSDRAPIVARTGPYKESAVNLRIAEMIRLLARLVPPGGLERVSYQHGRHIFKCWSKEFKSWTGHGAIHELSF